MRVIEGICSPLHSKLQKRFLMPLNASSHCYCVCNPLQMPGVFASYEFVCGSGWDAEADFIGRVRWSQKRSEMSCRLHDVDC